MRAADAPSHRKMLIAKVHVAKKALALEDDSYRALLRRVTGVDSAARCTDVSLVAVLDEFKRLGFEAPKKKRSDKPHVRLIYALWADLKPYLTSPTEEALRGFVFRQTGVRAPEWLNPSQANKVSEGLKAWLKRERDKSTPSRRDGETVDG